MTDIFNLIPKINYNGEPTRNLMVSIGIVKSVIAKYEVFFDYSIKDGERPDTIAHDYYGDSYYEWLVLLPNMIHDMYYQWPMDNRQFHDYLIKKYGKVYDLQTEIAYYEYRGLHTDTPDEIAEKDYKMTVDTFNNITELERSGWVSVSVYEDEERRNEGFRKIRLLSNEYLAQIEREILGIFERGIQ